MCLHLSLAGKQKESFSFLLEPHSRQSAKILAQIPVPLLPAKGAARETLHPNPYFLPLLSWVTKGAGCIFLSLNMELPLGDLPFNFAFSLHPEMPSVPSCVKRTLHQVTIFLKLPRHFLTFSNVLSFGDDYLCEHIFSFLLFFAQCFAQQEPNCINGPLPLKSVRGLGISICAKSLRTCFSKRKKTNILKHI